MSGGGRVMRDPNSIGNIQRLVVENFKSYEGQHVIGPMERFTGIIGPNGSGKSNLMEATAFVLGVQARHLRAHNMKEQIHRKEQERDVAEIGRSASVRLYFQKKDGTEIEFCRRIGPRGDGHFYIDSKNVSKEDYFEALKKLNILVEARNFLVFQGDVEETATKDPKEMAKLFEQVSGSELLREAYDKALNEKTKFFALSKQAYARLRTATQEKEEIEKQKKEADDYLEREKAIQKMKTELEVFKLYQTEIDTAQISEKLDAAKKRVDELHKDYQESKRKYDEAKEEEERLKGEVQKTVDRKLPVSKKIADKEGEKRSAEARVEHLENQREVKEQNRKQAERDLEKEKKKAKENESRLNEREAELKSLEETGLDMELQMTARQEAEYKKIQAETETLVATERVELEGAKRLEQQNSRNVGRLTEEIRKAEEQLQSAETEVENTTRDIENLTQRYKDVEKHVEEAEEELRNVNSKWQHGSSDLAEKEEKHAKLREELSRYADRTQMTEAEKKKQKIMDELKHKFGSAIHGYVPDLCEASQRGFEQAIAAALGKFNNDIVVDNEKTVQLCIQYLKEIRHEPIVFRALTVAKDTKLNEEKLKELGERFHWAYACVRFAPVYDKMFRMALGDSMIVNDLNTGKQLAYEIAPSHGVQVKVVTREGEKIFKNANLQIDRDSRGGGNTRIGANKHAETKAKLEELDKEIREIRETEAEGKHRYDAAQQKVVANRDLKEKTKSKLEIAKGQLKFKEDRVKNMKKMLKEKNEALGKAKVEVEGLEEKKKKLTDAMRNKTKDKFAKLSDELGVPDVSMYEEEIREARKKRDDQEAHLRRDITTCRNAKNSIDKRISDLERKAKEKGKSEDDHRAEWKSCQEKAEKIEEELERLKEKLASLKRDEDTARKEVAEAISATLDAREAAVAKKKKRGEKQQVVEALRVQIEQRAEQFRETLRQAWLDGIPIPLVTGSMEAFMSLDALGDGMEAIEDEPSPPSRVSRDRDRRNGAAAAAAAGAPRERDSRAEGGDPVDALLLPETFRLSLQGAPPQGEEGGEGGAGGGEATKNAVEIDYEILPLDLREMGEDKEAVARVESGYEDRISSAQASLSKISPNLGAAETLKEKEETFQVAAGENKQAKRKSAKAEQTFKQIKKERRTKFMRCYDHVKDAIGKIYSTITRPSKDEVGGQAFLDFEPDDEDHMFPGLIRYNVMPPAKRFFEMKALSGGERTMAAMALLFALHRFHPSPFFILDEVDAALDPKNVRSLAAYLKEASFQVLVISLKDKLFTQADVLIGTYKDMKRETSSVLSLRLTDYDNGGAGAGRTQGGGERRREAESGAAGVREARLDGRGGAQVRMQERREGTGARSLQRDEGTRLSESKRKRPPVQTGEEGEDEEEEEEVEEEEEEDEGSERRGGRSPNGLSPRKRQRRGGQTEEEEEGEDVLAGEDEEEEEEEEEE
uniref:Structural maintenance of chromosomes protein n=1 Tax=Chromera velia CCMP2878 TaxID=1169474 RepID=A0A0G4I2I1_9ALVE|eukprot:Cvel_10408.t1-p1 / transcript=Cvel_10408.t1 / gene=Cvel_10408 / organism=Chromera_velia_CCMP2878 / gene_product=Structural maintenance of chromosomes protein 1, putative / transcript_product=Structural maintenance of chromosomes protein 1, putative / location=Cvel_scaffold627:19480-34454(+) / protein_length=1449 / sequence_SO=supercontig / SO=protein_coding / is_pseudo=false